MDSLASLLPLPSTLPPPPTGEVFTEEIWTTLLAICDTVIPSITSSADGKNSAASHGALTVSATEFSTVTDTLKHYLPQFAGPDLVSAYLDESTSSIPDFRPSLHRMFGHYVPADNVKALTLILGALNTRAGSLLLTGSMTPFHEQPLAARTAILAAWSTSYLAPLRSVYRSLTALAKRTWIITSPTLPRMNDFPAVPKGLERPTNPPNFDFLTFPAAETPAELHTDVVIIGSGCGAGVCASRLAAAGQCVLVVEKGYFFPARHLPMDPATAAIQLMENGGALTSDDGGMAVLAGSTWGGGGTVNWSASLQPQHYVRREWAEQHGLPHFQSAEFQDCLDSVCAVMGVPKSTDHAALEAFGQHSFANTTLLEGSRRLGYAAEVVPQNTGGKHHQCGHCCEGCPSATKQGPAVRWLPDAAAHGAQFVQGCWVERVLFDDSKTTGAKRRAIGVEGVWTSPDRVTTRTLRVHAKRVIVSAGTLQSPLLLTRSGISNAHLGRNLHLHPVSSLAAVWDPPAVRPWEGPILTAAMTSLENLDGLGHGPKVETLAATPIYLLAVMPWRGAVAWKARAAQFAHSTGYVCIQRDRDTGRVYADPHDPRMVRIAYTVSRRDAAAILEGVLAAARVAWTMGARALDALHPDGEELVRRDSESAEQNDARFAAWCADVRARGITSPDPSLVCSAHQMGTCRMGRSKADGVVDSRGKVWGVDEGLYVADASVFPSASGVNPMITTMGIAEWISRGIVKEEELGGTKA